MKNKTDTVPGNGMDPAKLAAVKRECAEALARDRHHLLVMQPFIGNIAMRFDLVPVRDRRCRTACTDFKSVYFDCDFMLGLTSEERVFVLAHELWHNVTLTAQRRQTREAEMWNVASDMEINNILAEDGSGRGMTPPDGLLFPPSDLRGKSAETIYDWLLKQRGKGRLGEAMSNPPDGGSGGSAGKSGGKSGGKDPGRLEGQFDKHIYEGQDEGDSADESGSEPSGPVDRWGEVGYDDDFRPSVPADAAERMREAVISAAQTYTRDHGNLPANAESILEKFARPEISWREYLAQFVHSIPGSTRRWLPPSRRHVYDDMYFQSRRNETVKIGVFIDSSGSTVTDVPKFFGELASLVNTFQSYEIHLIFCDAAVDHYQVYDSDGNPFDPASAACRTCYGGGGTSFDPPFEFVAERGLDIDAAVYMTDGFASTPSVPRPEYPVMWLITKNGTDENVRDWGGKVVRFKESSWE